MARFSELLEGTYDVKRDGAAVRLRPEPEPISHDALVIVDALIEELPSDWIGRTAAAGLIAALTATDDPSASTDFAMRIALADAFDARIGQKNLMERYSGVATLYAKRLIATTTKRTVNEFSWHDSSQLAAIAREVMARVDGTAALAGRTANYVTSMSSILRWADVTSAQRLPNSESVWVVVDGVWPSTATLWVEPSTNGWRLTYGVCSATFTTKHDALRSLRNVASAVGTTVVFDECTSSTTDCSPIGE